MSIRIKAKALITLVFISCLVSQTAEASILEKRCPENWVAHRKNGFCYYQSKEHVDYWTAVKRCEDMSSTLITFASREEHAFVVGTLFKDRNVKLNRAERGSPEYWIGLRADALDDNISKTWSWIDGSSYSENTAFWNRNFPSGNYECTELHLQRRDLTLFGLWRDEHCNRSLRFLCKMAQKISCPHGFTYVSEARSCYAVIYNRLNWTNAGQECAAIYPDAHLAIVTTAKESNAIADYLSEELFGEGNNICYHQGWEKFGPMLWLAGERMSRGRCDTPFAWKPCPGRAMSFNYTRWQEWEPNCVYNEEFCVSIWVQKSYNWNDIPCFLKICSLCEYNPWFNDPLKFVNP